MFVSHSSSFLFYLYISASVQRKNRLARDKSFLAIPTMPWFTGKSGLCSGGLQNTVTTMAAAGGNAPLTGRLQNTVTTMAAAGGNAPLTPHTRHCASF